MGTYLDHRKPEGFCPVGDRLNRGMAKILKVTFPHFTIFTILLRICM